MAEEDDSREQGVEFGELAEKLEEHEYPATTDELLEAYGDYELELPNGTETFRAVLEPYGEETDEEFESAEGVRQAVFNMVGSDAVGRARYSDRGAETEAEGEDSESF